MKLKNLMKLKTFENIVGKGEIAKNEIFLNFPKLHNII